MGVRVGTRTGLKKSVLATAEHCMGVPLKACQNSKLGSYVIREVRKGPGRRLRQSTPENQNYLYTFEDRATC